MARGGVKSLNKTELAAKIFSLAGKAGIRAGSKSQFTETTASAFDKPTLTELAKVLKNAVERTTGTKQVWTK